MKLALILAISFVLTFQTHTGVQSASAAENSCPQGMVFNNALNRCVISQQTTQNKTDAHKCSGLEGEEYKRCFEKNAQEDVSQGESDGDISGATDPEAKYLVPSLITLGAGYVLLKKQKILKNCPSTSVWLLLSGGITTILGEGLAQYNYDKKLDGMAEDYRNRMKDNEGQTSEERIDILTENQTLAYDLQIEQEKARESAHKARKNTYNLAFGLYSAALLASIYEGTLSSVSGGMTQKCKLAQNDKEDKDEGADKEEGKEQEGEAESESESTEEQEGQQPEGQQSEGQQPEGQQSEGQQSEGQQSEERPEGQDSAPHSPPSGDESDIEAPSGPAEGGKGEAYLPTDSTSHLIALNKELFAPYYYIKNMSFAEVSEIAMRAVYDGIIPTAQAKTDKVAVLGYAAVFKDAASSSKMDKVIPKYVQMPLTRAIIAGLLATTSKKAADKADEHADEAKDRVRYIQLLKEDFQATGGAGFSLCQKGDRRNPKKPSCYCFTADSRRNKTHENTAVCKALFASLDAGLGAATDYSVNTNSFLQQVRGCSRRSGEPDPDCACRSVTNQSSPRACGGVSGQVNFGGLSNIPGLRNTARDGARFVNGNISAADVNGDEARNFALNVQKKVDDLKKKNKKLAPTLNRIDQARDKLSNKLNNTIFRRIKSRGGSSAIPSLSSTSSSTPLSPKDALKNLDKEVKRSKSRLDERKQGGDASIGGTNNDDPFDLGLDDLGSGGVIIDDEVASVMQKEFEFNDVNSNSEHNIFKIITNRYHRSGLKRLFDSNAKPVDAPNETDIHSK